MSWIEVLLLALALSADAFSVAVAVGLAHSSRRQVFRLSWHFGLFQAFMPFLGAGAGMFLLRYVSAVDHYLAFGILALLGARMLWQAATGHKPESGGEPADPTRGWSLVGLSLATSIDAFGAGIGLALARARLLLSCFVIGVTTGMITLAGMRIGSRLTAIVGRWADVVGGLVLIGLGVKMLGI